MSEHNTNIVVAGFIVRDGKIFIAKRAATKDFHPSMYEIIGGHVEPGETLETALRREVKEEIELDVRVGEVVDAFIYESHSIIKVEICYLCYVNDNTEPILHPEDHSEAIWIGEDEIAKFEKDDEETAALRKAFKLIKRR